MYDCGYCGCNYCIRYNTGYSNSPLNSFHIWFDLEIWCINPHRVGHVDDVISAVLCSKFEVCNVCVVEKWERRKCEQYVDTISLFVGNKRGYDRSCWWCWWT